MPSKNKIKILSEDLSNKIAAGEVVDRPASVVKELIENSIDAGSDKVTIIIKEGGKGLIQIVDNGTGMSREDAILSIQRHTTSKIANYDDLHNIHTLGFRGEALASIASVSRMELKTTLHNNKEGTLLKIDGGVIEDMGSVGDVRGTSIAIKNLFYNTPARRKFLKADATEYRYILNVINRFTLAFFQFEFTLFHNDQKIFNFKPGSPKNRLIEVLGARYNEKVVEVKDDSSLINIMGFIGKQDSAKKSRGDQYLFLNNRYIVNRALNHAIISAYGTIIPRGEFPLYALFLEIDPRCIDVNVHPSKMEVKFSDERLIYDILRKTVKQALASSQIIPDYSFAPYDLSGKKEFEPVSGGIQTQIPLDEYQSRKISNYEKLLSPETELEPQQAESEEQQSRFQRRNVWQIHNQYIISEIKSGVIIIDQHVAHERILYEKALLNFERRNPSSQQLLFPIVVDLPPEYYSLLNEILPFLEHLGYIVKGFGGHTVVIEGIPSGLKIGNNENILHEIIDEYKKNKNDSLDIRDNLAKSYACKSAIKAGEKLTLQEMNSLIDQLFATQSPYFCPHGRPVIINISIEELDKRFGRS